MSYLKRNLLNLIAIFVLTLTVSSCTLQERQLFFIDLGDATAQTLTLEQAEQEWTYEDATLAQKSVIKALEDQRNAYFMGIIASEQRPTDCYSAIDQVFPASAQSWAKSIVTRESRNTPTAQNARSTAAGCFQLLAMHNFRYYEVGCTPYDKYDALCNTKAAYHLYQQAGTSPWSL